MILTPVQTFLMIGAVALGVIIMRFAPFLIFPDHKEAPAYVTYLGRVLPAAVIGLLVVYCLKGVSVFNAPFGVPELISIACIGLLHFWKHNSLLSIGTGTVLYMILVQFVFV